MNLLRLTSVVRNGDDFSVVWVHEQYGRCTAEIVFDEASGAFKIDYQR
jgi:hypothetical protein